MPGQNLNGHKGAVTFNHFCTSARREGKSILLPVAQYNATECGIYYREWYVGESWIPPQSKEPEGPFGDPGHDPLLPKIMELDMYILQKWQSDAAR